MGVSTREYTLPVYIYDEDKGGKGKKLGHQIPSWIVRKVMGSITLFPAK